MKSTMSSVCLLAGTMIATNGFAEEYDFELDVAFGSSSFEGSKTIARPGGTIFNSGSRDTDSLSIVGNWYFDGLSDADGPRARAALVSRASSLSFGYGRTEQTGVSFLTNDDPTLPITPLDFSLTQTSDLFDIDLRYVDADSGWFGSVGVQSSNENLRGFVDESIDATELRLGVGRYVGENTTFSIGVGVADFGTADGGEASVFEISMEHLGDLGRNWQYAIDLGYDRTDGDFSDVDALSAAFSLYPTRDIEFGVAVVDTTGFVGLGRTDVGYEGFASWFVKPNIQLSARYRVDDVDFLGNVISGDPTVSDADSDSFGISATWRFD